jgi:predicted metalloendopeptidase
VAPFFSFVGSNIFKLLRIAALRAVALPACAGPERLHRRFYLAYSQSWRQKNRETNKRARLLSKPHSPEGFCVNGVERNGNGWYAAFPQIKPDDNCYLAAGKRAYLW